MKWTVLQLFSGDLWAGAEVMLFTLLKQLRASGRVNLIALSLNEGTLTARLREMGIEVHVIPEGQHSFLGIVWRAWRLLRGRPIAMIHAHRYKENVMALLLSWLLGIRLRITTLHGMPEPFTGAQAARALWFTYLNDRIIRWFFHAVAVSRTMQKVFVEQHRFQDARVTVIHNGVERPTEQEDGISSYGVPTGMLHVGTVGRMVPVKGYDLFLEIAAEIGKRTENVRFSILGDGPLKETLDRRRKALGLEGHLLFFCPRPIPVRTIDRLTFT